MSDDSGTGPDEPDTSGEPSDLRSVEGLRDEPEPEPEPEPESEPEPSASMSMAVVELRASRPGDEDDPDADAEHYDVESLPRGTQLGRYVLLGRVASRGKEVLYAAYDPEGDRRIGLKLFHPGGTEGKDARSRRMALVRQAQRVVKLSHPCVEQVYETGVYGPYVFLATEFIDGIDVAHWMEARDDPFPWPEVLRVFREAGRGLAAAHKGGIVHRDFKPSNILMGKEGRLVVVDFGLVHDVEEEDDDIDISQLRESLSGGIDDETEPTRMSGTPAYMAPEQHLTGYGDARSDQFSFCVALYEALYGERPFSGNRPRAIALEVAKHKVRPAPEGSTVPQWLRAIVVRGLSPQPQDRFASMEALLRELARDPADRRRRWVWGVALTAVLAASGGLVAAQVEKDRSACEDADGEGSMATVWGDEQRQALYDVFTGTERRWAEPTWRHTESRLDAWSREWRDLSKQACLATRVWADASERHYQLRQACLDRQLSGFEATLEILGELDGPMLDHAHELAGNLVGPRQCTDTETLVALGLPAEEQRDAVEALHQEMSALEARLWLHRRTSLIDDTKAVMVRAQSTGDSALLARGRLLLGQVQHAVGEPEADRSLHHAAQMALEVGDLQLTTRAWLVRMNTLLAQGRANEAASLGDYAEAMVVRKRYTWMWPTLEITRGNAELARKRPAEALALYHAAVEHEDFRKGDDRLRLVPAWIGQSDVRVTRGELDDALSPLQNALDVIHNVLGPHHPTAITVHERMGQVEQARGQLAEARSHFEHALQLMGSAGVDDPPMTAQLEASIGMLLSAEGDALRARPYLEQAYERMGGAAACSRPEVFTLGLDLARAHASAGDAPAARNVLEALLAPFRQRAFPGLERSRQPTTADRTSAQLLLATLMWQADEQAQAHERVTAVLGRLDDSADHAIHRSQMEQWLQEHPLP